MKWIGLEPVVVIFAVAYTIQQCVQCDFIFIRTCEKHYTKEICSRGSNPDMAKLLVPVQEVVVQQTLLISVVFGLTSVVSAQLIGDAFDKYSRKLLLLIPYMGFLVGNFMCVVIAAVPSAPTELLYLVSAITGASGGWIAFKACVSSYAVHECPGEERSGRLGVIEGLVFLGNAAGPFIAMLLAQWVTTRHDLIFLCNECFAVIAVLYIIFFVPDYAISQPPKNEVNTEYNSIDDASKDSGFTASSDSHQSAIDHSGNISNPPSRSDLHTAFSRPYHLCPCASSLIASLKCTFRRRQYGVRPVIIALLIADFFIAIVFAAEFDLMYLYLRDKLGFTFINYTNYLAFKNLVSGISLMLFLPFLRRVLGDSGLGVLGGLSRIVAFIFLAFDTNSNLVFIVPLLDMFGQYLFVALRAVISNLIQEDEQGRVFTVVGSMAQISLMLGSVFFDNLYNVFLEIRQSGITFLIAAGFMGISTIILSFLDCHLRKVSRQSETTPLLQ